MRFIARGLKYTLGAGQLRSETVLTQEGAKTLVTRWDDECRFDGYRYGPPTDAEVREAAKRLKFTGMGTELDEITPISIASQLSVFDTDVAAEQREWTPEQKAYIEKKLLENRDHGQKYFLVERERTARPWPKYDELLPVGRRTVGMVAEKIAEVTRDLGLDVASVVAYERENLNRPEVIAALEAIDSSVSVDDEITVSA